MRGDCAHHGGSGFAKRWSVKSFGEEIGELVHGGDFFKSERALAKGVADEVVETEDVARLSVGGGVLNH